ncbi:MAG: cytochrome c biogenesis CcdA family protein [Methylocystaceae bacterium]
MTFLSPCVLPLIPLYLGYLGASLEHPGRNINRVVWFILGFTLVFILLGLTATSIGHYLIRHQILLKQLSGLLLIILGIVMSGLLPWSLWTKEYRIDWLPPSSSGLGALLFGAAFALGWTPCTGPILAGILLLAGSADSMVRGAILLAGYSLGIGLPLLITAYFADWFWTRLLNLRPLIRGLQISGGLLMVLIGGLILGRII